MSRSEGNPLDGQQLANELDALFRSGDLSDLSSNSNEPEDPGVDEVLKERLNQYIYGFVSNNIKPHNLRVLDRRIVANQVRNLFNAWKPIMIDNLRINEVPQQEIQAVESLTLKDVADYAKEQFTQFSKEAATLPLGSPKQKEARRQSNHWSIIEEVISPAADPDQ